MPSTNKGLKGHIMIGKSLDMRKHEIEILNSGFDFQDLIIKKYIKEIITKT